MEPESDERTPACDPLDTLPAEVVLYLLRDFTFEELLPLLAVCSRWREAALSSPGYWSYITLESRTERAINLFLIRLLRSGDRPVRLRVHLLNVAAPLPPALRWQNVFSALRFHLHRVSWLMISLPGADFPYLWPALLSDAPKLRELHLFAGHTMPDGIRPVIAHNILSGNSCRLRYLVVFNVYLPASPVAAFSQVSDAQLIYDAPEIMPNVFSHFPRLEYIHFPAFASFEDPVFHRPSSYNNIKVAFLRSGRGLNDFPLPMAGVRDLRCFSIFNPRAHEIEEMFGQLQPPLECTLRAAPRSSVEQFELYAEERTGSERRRGFIDSYRFWSETRDPALPDAVHTGLSGRVHTLTVHAVNWAALMTCVGQPFVGLHTLRIYLSDASDVDMVSLALPSRQHPKVVSLEADTCLALFDGAVAGLVGRVFEPQVPPQTTLSLVNVHIVGAQTSFGDVFKDIVFEHHLNPCV